MCGGEGEVLKKGGESRIGRAKLEETTVNFFWWTFGGETGNFFRVSRSLSFFPVNEILSEPGCWTLKSWVFRVNEKRSLSEPEKLKISVWSIQVNWVWVNRKTTQKDLRTRKKVPCRTAKCPKGKVNIKQKIRKKNGNQLPQRQVLSQSTTKLFITQKETRYSFPIRSKAQNVGALEKILCAQPNTSFKSSWQL